MLVYGLVLGWLWLLAAALVRIKRSGMTDVAKVLWYAFTLFFGPIGALLVFALVDVDEPPRL